MLTFLYDFVSFVNVYNFTYILAVCFTNVNINKLCFTGAFLTYCKIVFGVFVEIVVKFAQSAVGLLMENILSG